MSKISSSFFLKQFNKPNTRIWVLIDRLVKRNKNKLSQNINLNKIKKKKNILFFHERFLFFKNITKKSVHKYNLKFLKNVY